MERSKHISYSQPRATPWHYVTPLLLAIEVALDSPRAAAKALAPMDACFNVILSLKAFIVNATAYLLVTIRAEDPRLWIDGRGYKMEESDGGHPAIRCI